MHEIGVGDIVICNYGKFNGDIEKGVFLVLYTETKDSRYLEKRTNITVAKITTNNFYGDSYVVSLRQGEGNLKQNSLVSLSKIHTFALPQVEGYIGTLGKSEMISVYKQYHNFVTETEKQVLHVC